MFYVILAFVFLICFLTFYGKQKMDVLKMQIDLLEKNKQELLSSKEELSLKLQEEEENSRCLHLDLVKLETKAEEERKQTEEKLKILEKAKEELTNTFKALSLESLEKNNTNFLHLAKETFEKLQERSEDNLDKKQQVIKEMLNPVKETLLKLDHGMKEIEKERKGEQATLKEQIDRMIQTENSLKEETATLVRALRTPHIRGRWGELQLKRIVEFAGMVDRCDFQEQVHFSSEEGIQRPDMIIHLPGDKQIVVDAKTPFEAFYDAESAKEEDKRIEKLKQHAKLIRSHIQNLGKKAYFESFEKSPEFVVLFLPSEGFFSAALEFDPSLIELGLEHKVILATPITLIGLLRAIAYGWKQEKISLHAQEIHKLGKELYKRVCDLQSHFIKLGKSLSSSVESYNKMMGSLESRVLSSARKFEKLGIAEEEKLDPVAFIEGSIKMLSSEEMTEN